MVLASLAVRRLGEGPSLVLVHGGAGPELTWSAQESLAARWALVIPWRRGFRPSPAAAHQDFDRDADDLVELLDAERGAHLVGFSYGGLATAIVSARRPTLPRSRLSICRASTWRTVEASVNRTDLVRRPIGGSSTQ